jgi:endonuclease YncB( thermonuclease family)
MRTHVAWLLVIFAIAASAETAAVSQQRISGRAKITDGDSFEIGDTAIRLFGIDAPEGRQPCMRDGREWACGEEAARRLRSLTSGGDVVCARRDVDDYGRVVAQCSRGGVDLAAEMARSGLAVAYRRYSTAYVDEENEARAARRGVWAGEFTPPDQWRRDDRAQDRETTSTPASTGRSGCDIKGNINGEGDKIYHTRASPSYADTRIDESEGERWFCSESEARRAGWRAPRG